MASIARYNSDIQDVGRVPQWFVFDVTGTTQSSTNEDIDLITVPANTIVLDCHFRNVAIATGAGNVTYNLQMDDDGVPVVLFTGTTNNGQRAGAVGTVDPIAIIGPLGSAPTVDDGSTHTLQTNHIASAVETFAGTMRISVLMFRSARP